MRIKRRLCAAVVVLVTHACIAQTTTPDVITTAGGYQSNALGSLSWTIGEPLIETTTSQQNYLTQGFQQPSGIVVTSVSNPSQDGSVTAYPNPVSSTVYVTTTLNEPVLAEVMDLTGQMVCKKTISGQNNAIDLSNVANGIYLLKVLTTGGKLVQTLKIDKIK